MKKRIQVRMRAIPARLVIEQGVKETPRKSFLDVLREWLGVLTAGASIFAVLLYLAGRSYAGGYFSAMNIPAYQVSFTLWEYGEVGWIPLLMYPVGMTFVVGFMNWILSRLFDWLSPWFRQFVTWLKQKISRWFPKLQFPERSQETRDWSVVTRMTFFALLLILVLVFTLQVAKKFGETNGQFAVLQNAAQVELVSNSIIPLDDASLVAPLIGNDGIYVYTGFHLLTFNGGKYYLFRDVDQVTCKPNKVYVIDANDEIHINFLSPVSLANRCQIKKSPTITVTTSPISITATP